MKDVELFPVVSYKNKIGCMAKLITKINTQQTLHNYLLVRFLRNKIGKKIINDKTLFLENK